MFTLAAVAAILAVIAALTCLAFALLCATYAHRMGNDWRRTRALLSRMEERDASPPKRRPF